VKGPLGPGLTSTLYDRLSTDTQLHPAGRRGAHGPNIDQFYGDVPPALPVGVVGPEADDDVEGPSGEVTPADAAR